MPLFLSDAERAAVAEDGFFWALLGRAAKQAQTPGLVGRESGAEWWHVASEHVTDVAMAHALKPSPALAAWMRDAALSIVRRPEGEWAGPPFRGTPGANPTGNLETAHLCWAVAIALDLAPAVFTDAERDEITAVLRERGIPMCLRFLESSRKLHNWRCILTAGVAVPAAVLNDPALMERAAAEFRLCCEAFQPDGTYAEGVQYASYAAFALMLTYEALARRDTSFAQALSVRAYAGAARWWAASLFYTKPLSGWGVYPRPRSANFNDAAALFAPGADVLLHISARAKNEMPVEAGLARWLFERVYRENPAQRPHDLSAFGFVNHFGFLTLPLLAQAAAPLSPGEAKLPTVAAFSCGDVLARDAWDGRTVLAVRGGGDPLCGPGHLHGDLNSFILVHNRERLLADPGHSCYRSLIREIETTTATHNTCTFTVEDADTGPDELRRVTHLQQSVPPQRAIVGGQRPGPPVEHGARRLLAERRGEVTIIGSEAAGVYGYPLREFARFWVLCGAHALLIVDRIVSDAPVRTTWNWLLNNRDGELDLKVFHPDRLVARRGNAGMKLFHAGGGNFSGPVHAFVHDAYHPLPNQIGEGRSGSGALVRWQEREPRTTRTIVHAIALDDYGRIGGWHWQNGSTLEGPGGKERWTLTVEEEGRALALNDTLRIERAEGGDWRLRA